MGGTKPLSVISNTVPTSSPTVAAVRGCAEQVAVGVGDQAGKGCRTVQEVEAHQVVGVLA